MDACVVYPSERLGERIRVFVYVRECLWLEIRRYTFVRDTARGGVFFVGNLLHDRAYFGRSRFLNDFCFVERRRNSFERVDWEPACAFWTGARIRINVSKNSKTRGE